MVDQGGKIGKKVEGQKGGKAEKVKEAKEVKEDVETEQNSISDNWRKLAAYIWPKSQQKTYKQQ